MWVTGLARGAEAAGTGGGVRTPKLLFRRRFRPLFRCSRETCDPGIFTAPFRREHCRAALRPGRTHPGKKAMESICRERRSYAPPRLAVYGRLEELTLTVNQNMNKNDPVQGGNNLKT
jgi:hypothetical protein